MLKNLIISMALILASVPVFAQVDTAWVRRYNGQGNGYDWAEAIAIDDSFNVYVAGYSAQSSVAPYNYDYITLKYYPNGDTAWLRKYNGPGNGFDRIFDLVVDASGNVYVTGYSYNGTNDDYATIKYYPNGDTAWVRRYDGPGTGDQGRGIAVDGSGNVYVTGYSHSGTNNDYFTIKYCSNGDTAWARRYDGTGYGSDEAYDIVVDGSGNVYVTGGSQGYMTLYDDVTIKYYSNGDTAWIKRYDGPANNDDKAYDIVVDGSGNVYVTGSSDNGSNNDYLTLKYYSDGNTAWGKRYNGPGNNNDDPYDIVVDGSGHVYVTGRSWDDTTSYDYTTIKYYSNGDTAWIRRYNNSPVNQYDAAEAIALDGSGNVYVAGYSAQSSISPYNHDYATIKYSQSGDELWVKRYNGPGNNNDDANDIVVDGSGNVYVTGGSDGSGTLSDLATVKYCLNYPNYPPKLDAIGDQKYNEGAYIVLNFDAFDLNGDSLMFSASNLPEGAYFNGENGVFLWRPTYAQKGMYHNIHFEVSDERGGSDSEDFTIEIRNYPQGDVTDDGKLTVSDVVSEINCLFKGGKCPDPLTDGDVTCDGKNTVSDIVYEINYLFKGGPSSCAPPSPIFILPISNETLNGLVWVAAQNLSDTTEHEVEFHYSSDSIVWNDLVFEETQVPRDYKLIGRTYQGAWNTDSLASGRYWLKVIMRDTIHNTEGTAVTSLEIDKNPTPVIEVSYDMLTSTVTFDASSSNDAEGKVISWVWMFCDSTAYQGSEIQKSFVPGDSCQVNLTVYDEVYNHSSSYNMLTTFYDSASIDILNFCECISIRVQDTGQIPERGWSGLHFGESDRKNPKGGKVLGPIDHHEKDSTGNDIPLGDVALYFMVEAKVRGNPEACSTIQYNNMTVLYDGSKVGSPKVTHYAEKGGKPFDPAHPDNPENPPTKRKDLAVDDVITDCDTTLDRPPKLKHLFEKITIISDFNPYVGGFIRWIDGPGPKDLTADHFKNNGLHVYDFKMFQVINKPPCDGTGCKKCIVWEAHYDKEGKRVNGQPPRITNADAPCPSD